MLGFLCFSRAYSWETEPKMFKIWLRIHTGLYLMWKKIMVEIWKRNWSGSSAMSAFLMLFVFDSIQFQIWFVWTMAAGKLTKIWDSVKCRKTHTDNCGRAVCKPTEPGSRSWGTTSGLVKISTKKAWNKVWKSCCVPSKRLSIAGCRLSYS